MIALTAQEYDENEYENRPVKSKPELAGIPVRRPNEPRTDYRILTMQQNFLESDDKLFSLGFFQHEDSYRTIKLSAEYENKEGDLYFDKEFF